MRLACFPLTPNVETLLRHREALQFNIIQSIISFHEDLPHLNQVSKAANVCGTTSFEIGLSRADALILFDDYLGSQWEKYFAGIDYAISQAIPVYASRMLIERIPDSNYQKKIIPIQNEHHMLLRYADPRLLDIKTPILAVMGMGENSGKFECTIELKEYLESIDCQAEFLCANVLGAYYGMRTLPDFLFDSQIAFPEKVLRFNQYVYDLCVAKTPDILIIEIPGGVVSLAEKDVNFFAELPLVISSAIHIDYSILSFYYVLHPEHDFLMNLKNYCRNRYQIEVPAFYMARQMLTYEQEGVKIKHLFLSDEYMQSHMSELYREDMVAAPNKNNNAVYQLLTQCLQENPETI